MGIFSSAPPPRPVKGMGERLQNVLKVHFRGLLGTLVPLLLIIPISIWVVGHNKTWKIVQMEWLIIGWVMLLHPVNVPVAALLPVVIFPLSGIMSTDDAAASYFNDTIALLIIAGMVSMIMNHTGVDKYLLLGILCWGKKYTANRLILRTSVAAFILSMLCNRSITCLNMYDIMMPVIGNWPTSSKASDDASKIRDVINNAIQTSSAIGSTVILHSAFASLAFKAMYSEFIPSEDIFNYLQYTVFVFPIALAMLLVNAVYYMMLLQKLTKRKLSSAEMKGVEDHLRTMRRNLPKMNYHQQWALFFTFILLMFFFTRWSQWTGYLYLPSGLSDATLAAELCILLHMLPNSCAFVKVFTAKTKDQMPPPKPMSAMLWWEYTDKNTNYAYLLLLGCGVAMGKAFSMSGYESILQEKLEPKFDLGYIVGSLVVIVIAGILPNIMTGVAACIFFLSAVLCFSTTATWKNKTHLAALAVGLASSYGFMIPFRYTPAFYCHFMGKTPKKRMARYSFGSVVICLFILWIGIAFYAPVIWPHVGMVAVTTAGTGAPGGGGGGGGGDATTPAPP